MVKTIKDMAQERYDFRKSTNPKNRPLVMRGFFAYQEGANAVLDVLSPILLLNEPSDLIVDRLLLTIADLKG